MKGLDRRSFPVWLASAWLVVGCSTTSITPSPAGGAVTPSPQTSPTATLEPSPTPTASPAPTPTASPAPTLSAADAAAVAAAEGIIQAVGGTVPQTASPRVLPSDPISGELGTYVEIGYWQVAWNSRGALRWVFSPDVFAAPDPAYKVTEAQAWERVQEALTALHVSLGAPDSFEYVGSAVWWKAQWDRKIAGVPVGGDATWVTITSDGDFGVYGRSETLTAPKPATMITKAQALAKEPWCKNGTKNGRTETCTIELVWHAPSYVEPKPPLRLCWQIQYSWAEGEDGGATRVWLDAGTGEEIDIAMTS
jgi:hypothetical protein